MSGYIEYASQHMSLFQIANGGLSMWIIVAFSIHFESSSQLPTRWFDIHLHKSLGGLPIVSICLSYIVSNSPSPLIR